MENLQIIKQQQILGKDFKVYDTIENPLFLAKDVAEWIDYNKTKEGWYDTSAMLRTIDEDEKIKIRTTINNPSGSEMWFLTEDGLYEVLMQSRKPIAKNFKKEVKKVLKQIRKTGGYIPANENDTDEDILAKAVLVAQRTIEKKNEIIEFQKQQLQEQHPKVIFADAVSASHTSILVGELAKILKQNGIDLGQNKFFQYLRDNGYLIKRKGTDYNMPTQRSMEQELFEIKETSISHSDGHVTVNKTPKISGKGQQYFINKFLQDQAMEEIACTK